MSKINILDDLQNQPNDKIEAIKKILPDCFDKDGNLIAGKLKEVLSGDFEKPDTERFTFNWAGKQKAREIAYKTYTEGTLKFDKDRSKNFETTKNLIIEGDNLQVLKLLKNSYKGKVKCIYIDPPYNTGSDFVYNDKFELDIKKYLIETGEIDEETGEQMADYIQKDDGKKHSKWLSFMYPRLMVAREMLREDGVIFISIDDNEVHHLRLLMNEVFGEGEFVGDFVWQKQGNDNKSIFSGVKTFRNDHESVIVYSKDKDSVEFKRPEEESEFKNDYGNADNDHRGNWMSAELGKSDARSLPHGKNYYTLTSPNGTQWTRQWHYSEKEMEDLIYENKVYFGKDGNSVPRLKKFLNETSSKIPSSLLTNKGSTKSGQFDLQQLFENIDIFSYPKPVSLIKHLLQISTGAGDLILDFFAGSGTTGQAVMELNQEELDKAAKDGMFEDKTAEAGGRKFILVQLPEKINEKKEAFKTGYRKISDITIERVKRAGQKYKSVDNGFKVLQLADNPDRENLWSLGNSNDNEFILTHLALLYGYGLNYKLTKIAEKEIYMMKSEIEKTKDAIIILEQKPLIMEDISLLIKEYGKGKYKFFSRDSALNIELTYNLLQHFNEDNVVVF